MHAYRPYQILRQLDQAPQMPFSYLFNLLLALQPTAWFAAMDARAQRYQSTNQSQMKLAPP